MESVKKLLLKRILPVILAFVLIVTSSIYPEKKVKAEIATLAFIGGTAIVALILSALASQGAISGDYTVTAPDLSAIQEKAQANLQAAGANAVEQANRLGEAIKSGAESAKIKALASGAVIYAFLSAVQDTLFQKSDFQFAEEHTDSTRTVVGVAGSYMVVQNISSNYANYHSYFGDITPSVSWNRLYDKYFRTADLSVNKDHMTLDFSYIGDLYYVNKTTGVALPFTTNVSASSEFIYISYDSQTKLYLEAFLFGNTILSSSASEIASAPSVTMPTVLPQTIINNINNWDGTSDLVLAPPRPYDIPTGEDLVIDPSYVGEGTVDPPAPTTDPDNPPSEEEGITLPWLAALLGLLGLGQLTGIDEGIKSGIDNLVDSITNTAQDVYDGVRDWADTASSTIAQGIEGVRAKLGEIAGAITGGLALGIESLQSALGSIAETIGHAFDPPSKNVDWDKLKNIQLFNKFPFSIPSDLYYLFGLVAADPVAPCVKIPFDMTFLGGENIDATVDLATYDNVAAIIRNFEFIAFVIGMLYLTKSLIWK